MHWLFGITLKVKLYKIILDIHMKGKIFIMRTISAITLAQVVEKSERIQKKSDKNRTSNDNKSNK